MEDKKYNVKILNFLESIVPEYLAGIEVNIQKIETALLSGDMETVRVLGHNMKGSGGGYGFNRITELGAEIESAAKEADTQRAKNAAAGLSEFLAGLEIEYIDE